MKKVRTSKVVLWIASVALVAILSVSLVFMGISLNRTKNLYKTDFSSLSGLAEKTVLFIGDGMGENHIKTTEAYYGEKAFMRSLGADGYVTTFSNRVGGPTDSAAAGSALATGQKYNNGEIARHGGKDVKSIAEYAKAKGLGVGIVTTDNIYGATPASFSSHANNRNDTEDIIKGQINDVVDLYLGAGRDDYLKYKLQFENKGFAFATSFSDILGSVSGDKLIAAFSSLSPSDGTADNPTLEMCTEFALEFMESRFPNGYFLMIEGAHIDKKSHANEIVPMTSYLKSFDNSIKIAYDKLQNADSAIIVTADHETGGLKYNEGETKDDINNDLYTTTSHTETDVRYFIFVKKLSADELKAVVPEKIDNTDVNRIARSLLAA